MIKLIKQPLLHFLLLGLALFFVFAHSPANTAKSANNKTIVINRKSLLTYMQYRNQAFNEQYFSQQLDSMNKAARQSLINDMVRDDVLYREALSMHLEDNDYVIKRRLIQKIEFLTKGFITAGTKLTKKDVKAYYMKHKADYYQKPYATFTHVFFDYKLHSHKQAMALAKKTLKQLNEKKVSFSQGIQYGDRFLYYSNYVERAPGYIASHFGDKFTKAVFKLKPSNKHWYGPFESIYGVHLVMLTQKKAGHYPALSEIYDRVKDDAKQDVIHQKTEAAIEAIVKTYRVKVSLKKKG